MPAGPAPLGFAYFAGVKFIGYTGAVWALARSYQAKETSILKVGAARTALGLVAGAAYGGLFFLLARDGSFIERNSGPIAGILYFGGLIPVRLAEWSFIIWYFFRRGKPNPGPWIGKSWLGVAWSFVLDTVGIFTAIAVPGGVWIC